MSTISNSSCNSPLQDTLYMSLQVPRGHKSASRTRDGVLIAPPASPSLMESPDVVDTSDVEEREVFSVSQVADRLETQASSPQSTTRRPESTRRDLFTDHDIANPTPRKRVKVRCMPPPAPHIEVLSKIGHDANSALLGSAYSIAPKAPSLNDDPLSVAALREIPALASRRPPEGVAAGDNDDQLSVSFPSRDVSPLSDWHSLFSSPSGPSGECNTPDTISRVGWQNMWSSSQRPRYSISRPPISTAHYPQPSSPLCRPTTPPQTSSQHWRDQSSSRRPRLHLATSSPLTPVSSPTHLAQTPSSPDPLQLLSSQRPQAPHLPPFRSSRSPHTIPLRDPSPTAEIPEDPQPLNRYSLRRREARQLNPYAYDKLVYKQQLKSHPDAFVKFRSSQRHTGSGGEGKDEAQEESIFFNDNSEEDCDYVDVEDESGRRRRRRAGSLHGSVGGNDQGQETRRAEEGWLPETLKKLSSSDDDDDEIHKFARRIQRERKKAEALARAEVKKVAATKPAKQRPKPFPVHVNARHASGRSPEQGSPESSLSQSPFPRARSEPAVATQPPSSRSPLRTHTPSRTSSHSPTSLNDLRFPACRFDDDVPLPSNIPPVDLSDTYSLLRSPAGPSTTSSASALPSNASGMESESDQPTFGMSSKDRKRLRALRRMMPAAMIARQLGVNKTARRPPSHARAAADSSGSEAEEVRLIPGFARVRKGQNKGVEVKGDPESSDLEPAEADNDFSVTELFSDGQSAIKVSRTQPAYPRFKHEDDVISLSDSSLPGSSPDDSESGSGGDDKVHQSLFDRPPRDPARERSLIDWMLTRTRGPGGPKSRSKQLAGLRKSRRSGASRLNIVTDGARRYGEHHQTRLPFTRADTSSSAKHTSRDQSERFDFGEVEGSKKRKKERKRQSGANPGPIYNIHHDATRITSKHRVGKLSRTVFVVENDDHLKEALDPGWRAEVERWNKPLSSARQPAMNPKTRTLATSGPRLYRRLSPEPHNELPLPFYFHREEEPFASTHRHIVVDMNITPFPSGVKFGASSYIGKGLLHQLVSIVSGQSEVTPPMSCNMQGLEIGPTTSTTVFSALLGPLCDRLAGALHDFEVDVMKEWESVMHAACKLLSWLAIHAEDQEFGALEVALREYLDGLLLVLESLDTTVFSLAAYWFAVELFARLVAGGKYRKGSAEDGCLIRSAKQLVQRLLDVDLWPAFATFYAAEGNVDVASLPCRAAELWVCLIHLLANFEISTGATSHPFWCLLADLHPESSPTGAEASEDVWRTIFNLCAISQFSIHGLSTSVFRLPAAWELVAAALKKIILASNPEKERLLPQRALKKRDDYISCVVSRCFLLWSQWGWRLDDGIAMFKSLQEIFRSRNFANLLNERSAPMGFLENSDLELLSKRDVHDSVFEIFLKMVVQAVYLLNTNIELDAKQRSTHVKKLLQLAVPVSPVPFSRTAPPTAHSLSMLVNRFSAMVIAVHLDPTVPNVKFRVGQARRCVSFRDADDQSRVACVYGMMNFAMIVRHHKITGGLEEVLAWLGEMGDVLMDEYKEGDVASIGRKPTTTLIQLLVGSVRRVMETPSLDKGNSHIEYPDPALLDGPWVTRVFNPRTDLMTMQQTGVEIRLLVQSFLDARIKALPAVQPPLPPVVHSVKSQESQDEYDKLPLGLDDEELLAALGEEVEASAVADLKSKEDALCKVLDKSITPAVYRLVCKYFLERENAKSEAATNRAADEWIDCWVGCANVLVQNNYKDWGLYMKLGQQSWEKIIDDSWRRRVGLRFNLTLLRLDPGAYSRMKDDFIAVLLVATLSRKATIEHEFVSLVLSLDGLQHPLLRAAPFNPIPGTRKYEVSEGNYNVSRERLIETIFANTAARLRAKVDAESQTYAEMVVMMLSTMRDIHQSAEDKAEYGAFCRRVFDMLSSHVELASHPRMAEGLGWGRRVVHWG